MSLNADTTTPPEAGPSWTSLQQAAVAAQDEANQPAKRSLFYKGKHRMTPAEEAEARAARAASNDTPYEGRRRRLI